MTRQRAARARGHRDPPARDGERGRLGELDRLGPRQPDRQRVGGARVLTPEQGGASGQPAEVDDEQAGRDRDREHLDPELKGLDVGDAAHAADGHVDGDDRRHQDDADPVGRAGHDSERQAGPLELGQQIEPADEEHDRRGQRTDAGAAQPRLREVGNRVGAKAPQRGRDEQQQGQIAGGEAERLPQGAGPELHLQAGNPQKARRRQVLARDRRGVPPCRHRARGHQQVRRRAHEPHAPCPQPQRADGDGADRQQRGHARRPARPVTSPPGRGRPRPTRRRGGRTASRSR